jgi:hypothetical protein
MVAKKVGAKLNQNGWNNKLNSASDTPNEPRGDTVLHHFNEVALHLLAVTFFHQHHRRTTVALQPMSKNDNKHVRRIPYPNPHLAFQGDFLYLHGK